MAYQPAGKAAGAEVHAHPVGVQRRRWTLHVRCHEAGSTALGLEAAHRELQISPGEFDEVAAELGRTLDHFGVPSREKDEVLSAFAAHKGEVTEGSMASA